MGRKRFSEREVIETLLHQGSEIRCFRCGEPFGLDPMNEIPTRYFGLAEREHLHEIALGGPDEPENCRYSCHFCHGVVTNGSPATTAGSSKHRIAKTKGTRAEKFAVKKLRLDKPREKPRTFGNTTFRAQR